MEYNNKYMNIKKIFTLLDKTEFPMELKKEITGDIEKNINTLTKVKKRQKRRRMLTILTNFTLRLKEHSVKDVWYITIVIYPQFWILNLRLISI